MIQFTSPYFLLLFIPAIAGLIYSFKHIHGMMRGRKRLAFAIRFLLLSCIVLALAGPEAHRKNEGLCTIFVLDRSDSITEADRHEAEGFVNRALKTAAPEDQAALIAFGKDPVVDQSPSVARSFDRILSVVDGSSSDLAAAIRLASASFPDGKSKRIVVLSDGNETSGDAMEAAEVAGADGIDIDYVALGVRSKGQEVTLTDLQAPNETRAGQPFQVQVVAESTFSGAATLNVDRDGVVIKSTPVSVSKGRNIFTVEQTVDDVGLHRYRASLTMPGDSDNRNNIGMGFVGVKGKPRVLVAAEKKGGALAKALAQQNIVVDDLGPTGVPVRPEEFQIYDAILFDDLNATNLTDGQMKLLRSAVRDSGVGFAMVGGENSFLPGGWYGTPVAEALPIDMNIRQRKTFPSTSVLIVIDTSGSMGMIEDGVPKVRLAAKAGDQTVMLMSPIDRVGVAGSTDAIEFVAPMQEARNKAALIAQVERLDVGGGGIYCKPSLEFAKKNLEAEPSKVRHLILMADGNDTDMQENCLALASAMRAEKITTSVISIGDGKDVPFLKQLAATGGGQFYLATRASQLPTLATQDTAIMSRSAIEEGAFMPKVAFGEEILKGIDTVPPLYGYCLTDTRPMARNGMKTAKDDPLLATWQYGLGTALAFTSDAQPRWATRWVPWSGFSQFWAQAVRDIVRRASSNKYQIDARHDGAHGVITLKATDSLGNPINDLPAQVRLSTPSGDARDLTLAQTAPGEYKGTFDTNDLGSYIVAVSEDDGHGGKRISTSGFSLPYPPEYRSTMANTSLLARIAKATGGRELTTPEGAERPIDNPGFSIQELWTYFVFFAAALLPLDVATRRIALPVGEILRKLLSRVHLRRQRQIEKGAQVQVVERLSQAKKRAGGSSPDGERPVSSPAVVQPQLEEKREAKTPVTQGSVASTSRLLDLKRKKGQDEERS